MPLSIKLIVGLGNPGSEYQDTRHNAGAILLDKLAYKHSATLSPDSKFSGMTARCTIAGKDIRLLFPTTYMNLSGQAVAPMAQFFKIEPEEILVLHDEIDLPPGVARLKEGGGAGGNNGLKDIIKSLGNNNKFKRLRIGVGHPGSAPQVASYVLKKPPASELQLIEESWDNALDIIPSVIEGNWQNAMKELHSKKATK